jgi:hypothetical protein
VSCEDPVHKVNTGGNDDPGGDLASVVDAGALDRDSAPARLSKKPGGYVTDQRQLSLVLFLVLFLSLGLASKIQNSCDSTKVPHRVLVSECGGGVVLWYFKTDSQ